MSDDAMTRDSEANPGWDRARGLVLRYGWNAMAYQILNPGMRHWFAPDGEGVVGYVPSGGACVVAGAPICPEARLGMVALAFEDEARRRGRRVCYFGAQDRLVEALGGHHPVARLQLGAQPVWNPRRWPAILGAKASLRAQIARARNKQLTVEAWPAAVAQAHPTLRRCLEEWLTTRGLPPMHFLVEPNTLGYLLDRRVFVAERGGEAVAFLVASPIPRRSGWLIEQIVRGRHAPNGTAELLIDTAMRALLDEGAAYLTLGLSPLSRYGRGGETPQLPWMRALLALTRLHGRRFYNFAGLDAFKDKLQPDHWEPVYALSHERWTSLGTLWAIAGAFSGSPPAWFIGRALLRALRQELAWAGLGV